MKQKYLLLIIILFTCLFLFSTPSSALIPGDFGSAGGGLPDGVVDFEDLMIFALAYGSTEGDANWNPVCDIASEGGVLEPDGVIDFEDLMIFAMHYGQRDKVNDVWAVTITYQSSMSKLQDKINQLEEEGKLPASYKLNEPKELEKGVTGYEIYVGWHSYYGATGYRVYRSVNGGSYSVVLDETTSGYTWYGFWDDNVSPGSTYSYYVTAYGSDWETEPSQIVTRDTFLPPCSLINPPDGSVVSDPNPVFTWNPVGVSSFPYGSIYSGNSGLWIYNITDRELAWYPYFDNLTTSSASYNQDGQAIPLVASNCYEWDIDSYGYDENGKLIAYSWSEYWYFGYGEAVVFDVGAYTITYQSSMSKLADTITELEEEGKLPVSYKLNEPKELEKGVTGYEIYVDWHSYYGAAGYRVYRSVNGGSYSIVLDEPASGYTWYGFWDNNVSPGNTYSYYVTAYGDFGETAPSETVTRKTFLPPCSLNSPPDGSVVSESTPTFNWNPAGVSTFPYDGTIYSGETYFRVYDANTYDTFWRIWFEDMTTSTATYNQDGYATPLVSGSTYTWYARNYGYDENGNFIAISRSEYWYFGYGEPVVFNVGAYTITYQSSMSKLADTIAELEEEGKLPVSYKLNEPQELEKGVTGYEIYVDWHSYYGATGYRVYRSVDGGGYSMVLDEPASGYTWYGFWDDNVSSGNTYSYYVTAYGDFGETAPSETITRKTFLPPCSLNSPPDGSVVSESTPTFNWNPAGVSTFPYDGTIYSGETYFRVYDANTYDTFWRIWFEDMTTSTATYNQDGYATPLVSGSTYTWYARNYGYDENGNFIAISRSEYWYFGYGEPVVFNVGAYTITNTYQSSMSKLADTIAELEEEGKIPPTHYLNEPQELAKGVIGYEICVNWHSYYGATGYRVYRSVNEGSYSVVLDETASGYTWYGFWDNEVSPGSTYSYYVTAYGSFGETNPSQIVTRNTFLPPCSLVSPPDGSIVTESTPTFNWNPAGVSTFPYDGTIYSGETYLRVYDANTYDTFWRIWFEDMTTSTATYNQDGYATPLVSDSTYKWFACSHGFDESGNLIAVSRSEDWEFSYGPVPPPPPD